MTQSRKSTTQGQALPEYGLTLVLIAVACIAALQLLGTTSSDFLTDFAGRFLTITGAG